MDSTGTLVFYAAAVTILAAFFLFNAAMKNRVGLYYAALFAMMLGLVWFLEGGLAAAGLVDDAATVQSIGVTLGLFGAALGFFTAERAIDPRRAALRTRRSMLTLAVLSLLPILPAWLWSIPALPVLTDCMLAAMVIAHLIATLTWRTSDGRPFRLPAITAALLLLALAVVFLVFVAKGDAFAAGTLFRWLFALVTLPAMAAIGIALVDVRKSRDAALHTAAAAARRDADRAAALLEAERNYARARDIAARRKRQISTVSHDIRQPIAALRAELDGLKGTLAAEDAEKLDRILDHFDALTGELSRTGGSAADDPADDTAVWENVPVRLLFSMLERMFGAEAKSKGIDLRFVASGAVLHVPAVILMRISANLVANAIHHSRSTCILVGMRRSGAQRRLDIIDNGIGLPNADAMLAEGAKGAESDGAGLGLSIVRDLSDAHGFSLGFQSREGKGTRFSISLPSARD